MKLVTLALQMCFSDPGSVLSKLKKLFPPQCDVMHGCKKCELGEPS